MENSTIFSRSPFDGFRIHVIIPRLHPTLMKERLAQVLYTVLGYFINYHYIYQNRGVVLRLTGYEPNDYGDINFTMHVSENTQFWTSAFHLHRSSFGITKVNVQEAAGIKATLLVREVV